MTRNQEKRVAAQVRRKLGPLRKIVKRNKYIGANCRVRNMDVLSCGHDTRTVKLAFTHRRCFRCRYENIIRKQRLKAQTDSIRRRGV